MAAIGFLPGFVFLDGLDDSLQMPRLEQPRAKVPKGTVGIGGHQTGWYAIESPGGWNSIGRTPLLLMDLGRAGGSPTPFQVGDWIRFRSISVEEFKELASDKVKYGPVSNDGARSSLPQSLRRIRVKVLDAGLWTSIQDGGRLSSRLYGIPRVELPMFSVGATSIALESRVYRYFGACFGMYLEGSKVEVSG